MGQDLGGTALAFVHDQVADAVPDFAPETHHLAGVTNGDELPRLVHALGKEAHFRAGNLKEILNLGQPAFEQVQFWNQHQGGLATLGYGVKGNDGLAAFVASHEGGKIAIENGLGGILLVAL